MENGIEPKRTISLTWDDPWKKYEERWKKKPRGEGRALTFDVEDGPKGPSAVNLKTA